MKVGLFFGSFNPVHNGHMMIANYFAEFTDLEQVWLVVSPHNPLKPAGSLLNDYQRLHNSVTLEQVNAAAKKYLHPDTATLVIAGPLDDNK